MPAFVGLFLVLAAVYSVVNPLFEAPDEIWHYGYVYSLARGEGLPDPADAEGAARWAQEGSQPPLYYLLAGLLTGPLTRQLPRGEWEAAVQYNPHAAVGDATARGNRNHLLHGAWDGWPWRGMALAAHTARFFSILLGACTVALTYGIAQELAPKWELLPPLAAALVACNPQFLFLSASVSNDNLVAAVSAAAMWVCVRVVNAEQPLSWRWLLLLGALVGAGALAKLSGLLLAGLAVAALGLAARRQGLDQRGAGQGSAWVRWACACGVVLGAAALVSGWWYWRNWRLTGDLTGLAGMFAVLPARAEAAGPAELLALGPGVWRSTWAVFGWFNVTAPEWVYWLYGGLSLLGASGLVRVALDRKLRQARGWSWPAALLLGGWSLAVTAALVRWAQINYPQGRLLFPAISAAMALLAAGLLAWWPRKGQEVWVGGVTAGMAALALAAPFAWIAPAYAPPEPLAAAGALPNALSAHFGEQVQLVGYAFAPQMLRPGEALDVTLYWRSAAALPVNYSVFVHLVDELGIVQAQSDSYPAGGSRPTRGWSPGEIVADAHQVRLPPALAGPQALQVVVGLYEYETGRRLPIGEGDSLPIGAVQVAALVSAEGIPNPLAFDFDGKIGLRGYTLDRRGLRAGEQLQVRLWYEALAPMQQDYVVFVHLVLPPDAVWAQADRQPQGGAARTSTWSVGELVEDSVALALPAEMPAGVYDLVVGWYDKDSFARLPVNFSDKPVLLARVRVEEQ